MIFSLYPLKSIPNDSGIEAVGGTWIVMKGEHPSIQMEREKININVYEKYYDVEAKFIFKNLGDSCSVFMGFPETGGGDIEYNRVDSSRFLSFSTSVNGKNVEVIRVLAKKDFDDEEYIAYWIKYVSFEKGETKKVIVKYRSPLGGRADRHRHFISYNFSGGNWFGKVLESKLNLYFHMPVELSDDSNKGLVKKSDRYTYYRTNWEAEEYFYVAYKISGKNEL